MHSRIFQLSLDVIPLDDYIKEEDFYEDPFLGSVADYVSDDTNRDEDIKWLKSMLEPLGAIFKKESHRDVVIFPADFKRQYYNARFLEFKKLAQEMTLDEFCGWQKPAKLSELISDKYGFYIYVNYPEPIDDFVRTLSGEKEEKYYIGGTIDYHF